jgi:hypothetical protein
MIHRFGKARIFVNGVEIADVFDVGIDGSSAPHFSCRSWADPVDIPDCTCTPYYAAPEDLRWTDEITMEKKHQIYCAQRGEKE